VQPFSNHGGLVRPATRWSVDAARLSRSGADWKKDAPVTYRVVLQRHPAGPTPGRSTASGLAVLKLNRPLPALLLWGLWTILLAWAGVRLSAVPVTTTPRT